MTTILDQPSDLENLLEAVLKTLAGRDINHAEVEDMQAGTGMATATMVATDDESITKFVQDGAHVFYRWDVTFEEDSDDYVKGLLQFFVVQNGLLYKWDLCTSEWAVSQQEERFEFEQDRLDPMRGVSDETKAIAKQIENAPDEFVESYVEAAVKGFDDNDLTGNYHQIRHLADRALGTHAIPYRSEAYGKLQEMQPDLKRAIEEHLDEKRERAIEGLVQTFPRWYREKGAPRMSKNLVKVFAQEQGYRFPNHFVDDLKVQIDIAIARAN